MYSLIRQQGSMFYTTKMAKRALFSTGENRMCLASLAFSQEPTARTREGDSLKVEERKKSRAYSCSTQNAHKNEKKS